MKHVLPLCVIALLLAACGNSTHTTLPLVDSVKTTAVLHTDKALVLDIAQQVLDSPGSRKSIWNLSDVDTTDYTEFNDYFTSATTKTKLVLIAGTAGSSAGTARNMLLLFNWSQQPQLLWAGQVSAFGDSDIKDLNNDGIKEIVMRTEVTWMGECFSDLQVISFKGGDQHILYDGVSHSLIDCGMADTIATRYKPGDTLATEVTPTLISRPGGYAVKQVTTYRIHNGGNDDDELMKRMKVVSDSAVVELK